MKSVVTIGITAAVLAVLLVVSTFWPESPAAAPVQARQEAEVVYIVREQDGYLAVFVPDRYRCAHPDRRRSAERAGGDQPVFG